MNDDSGYYYARNGETIDPDNEYDDILPSQSQRTSQKASSVPVILFVGFIILLIAGVSGIIIYSVLKKQNVRRRNDETPVFGRPVAEGTKPYDIIKNQVEVLMNDDDLIAAERDESLLDELSRFMVDVTSTPGRGDPETMHPGINPSLYEKLKLKCPPGKIIKHELGTANVVNCYEPCPPGWDVFDSNSQSWQKPTGFDDLELWKPPNGVERPDAAIRYYGCRPRCKPRDSVLDKPEETTACSRKSYSRWDYIGKGPAQVKCPYIKTFGFGKEKDNNWKKRLCPGREKDFDCYTGQAMPWGEGKKGLWNGDSGKWGSENSVCLFDRGYNVRVQVEPVACGHDYELTPVTRYAYWTLSFGNPFGTDLLGDDGEQVWKQLGVDKLSARKELQQKMIGRRCVKQCDAGTVIVGDPEDMRCAEPCPAGTSPDPTDPTFSRCLKDGHVQKILIPDIKE